MAAYTLKPSDPQATSITVAPLTIDDGIKKPSTASTSLYFAGRGIPNFGEGHQTNFLRLLENFASYDEPSNPIIGQLWHDKNDTHLKSCIGFTAGGAAIWRYVAADAVATGSQPPGDPDVGDLWYDVATGILYVYNGSQWLIPQACACQVSATPPPKMVAVNGVPNQTWLQGQMWYNTGNQTLMIWNATRGVWAPAINEAFQYLALLM